MDQPRVLCLMLTKDRPELARKAVECFRKQTYRNKALLIWDSGTGDECHEGAGIVHMSGDPHKSIGELRNDAIRFAPEQEIIIHWDDDDWSHPRRIEDQVYSLTFYGIQCSGYHNMFFWRDTEQEAWRYESKHPSDMLGTSLCYWRETWNNKPFEEISEGEDTRFVSGLKVSRMDGVFLNSSLAMIARIHKGNENKLPYRRELMLASANQGGEWTRVPQWDDYCRKIME